MPDHARKGRPKKPAAKRKSNRASKKPSATHANPRVWLMLLIVIGISSAFGYLLMTINGSADSQPTSHKKTTTQSPTTHQPLPAAPTESWVYESLDKKEIVIDLPQDKATTQIRQYRLQCASFRTLSQAEKMKASMAFMGEEPNIKKVKGSTGYWYKVILGPFESKRQAEKTRHKMQREHINTCELGHWPQH